MTSPVLSGLASRAHRLRLAFLFQGEHHSSKERDEAWALRLRPFGLTGSSAMNLAQENSSLRLRVLVVVAVGVVAVAQCQLDGSLITPYPVRGGTLAPLLLYPPSSRNRLPLRQHTGIAPLDNVSHRHPAPAVVPRTVGVLHLRAPGHATPRPERRPEIVVSLEGDVFTTSRVEHHEPRYEDVKAFVADYPRQFGSGYFILPPDAYREVQVMIGVASSLEEQEVEAARLARWREAEVHWEYVDAFQASMEVMMEDKVIGVQESRDFCYKAPQWEDQLVAAQEYVAAYREVEPTVVAETPRLLMLELEAERALELVMAAECVGLPSAGGLATTGAPTRTSPGRRRPPTPWPMPTRTRPSRCG